MTLSEACFMGLLVLLAALSLASEVSHQREVRRQLDRHLRALSESWRRHGGQ